MLKELRKKLECTRRLMFWHDGSTLVNHSHILMTVSALYDPAVYITDQEYFKKYKKPLNIQTEVEKRYLHLMGSAHLMTSNFYVLRKELKT